MTPPRTLREREDMRSLCSLARGARLCLLTSGLIVSGAVGAHSQVLLVDKNTGDVRVGLLGGAYLPDSTSFNGQGVSTVPFSSTGKIKIDPGAAVAGFISYGLNEYVNVDGVLGYSSGELRQLSGTLDLGPLGKISGKFPLKGSASLFSGYANLMIAPFGINEVTPYLGGGPGFAVARTETRSLSVGGVRLPIKSESSELKFAADVLIGADFRISEKLDIGVAYSRFWIDTGGISSGAISGKRGSITGQVVGALLEYRL